MSTKRLPTKDLFQAIAVARSVATKGNQIPAPATTQAAMAKRIAAVRRIGIRYLVSGFQSCVVSLIGIHSAHGCHIQRQQDRCCQTETQLCRACRNSDSLRRLYLAHQRTDQFRTQHHESKCDSQYMALASAIGFSFTSPKANHPDYAGIT